MPFDSIDKNKIDKDKRFNYWSNIYLEKNRDDFWYHLAGADKDISQINYSLDNSSILYYFYRFEFERKMLTKFINKFCQHRELALDAGCGSGRNTLVLSEYFERVESFDSAEQFINENKRRYGRFKNIYFSQLSLDNLSRLVGKKYDLIFLGGVFMYLSDEEIVSVKKNLRSLLNEDGVVITRDSLSSEHAVFSDQIKVYRKVENFERLLTLDNFYLLEKFRGASRNFWCSSFRRLPKFIANKEIILNIFKFFIYSFIFFDVTLAMKRPFKRHKLSHQLFYVFKAYAN